MASTTGIKKIIWALDPYGDLELQASAKTLVETLSKSATVEVVHVHGRSGFLIESKKQSIRWGLADAQEKLQKYLKQMGFKGPSQILASSASSVRAEAKTLASYAKKSKADVVLLTTKARTGILRQVLGSFAETLILQSLMPAIIINPKAKVSQKPGTILFPTDFSDSSHKAFKKVVHLAKTTGAKIKLFHQYYGEEQNIPSNTSYFQGIKWVEGDELLEDDLRLLKSRAKKWLAYAEKEQIQFDITLKFGRRNIADAILDIAKKEKTWMIAMASVTGAFTATFLGSNARWVVRDAMCPVWVMHVEK